MALGRARWVVRIENSFIPVRGVGERTERDLWAAGITTWDAFDGSVVGPTLASRVRRFVDVASDHLARRDARFFGEAFPAGSHWRLYEDFREEACFLDIETTGLDPGRDEVTVVSLVRAGETTTLVRGRDLDRSALLGALAPSKLLVTFNGKRFDVPFIEAAFGLDVDLPHLDLLYPCRDVGLTGGLKAIERALDIDRDRRDLSGRDAIKLWRRFERGDESALETLVAYNRADTENLLELADHVTGSLHDRVFESARAHREDASSDPPTPPGE